MEIVNSADMDLVGNRWEWNPGLEKEKEKMAEEFDYQEWVKIDPYDLDKEWVLQPEYALRCMEALAQARRDLDEAKENYSLVCAEVDREIRAEADKKPTEKAIEGYVLMDDRVQEAQASLIEAKYNVNVLEAAKAGLENRRDALTNLVKLHGMGYFAEPEADIQARGQLEEMRQQAVRNKVKIGNKKSTTATEDRRDK